VVADEVRHLAEQSQEAAGTITEILAGLQTDAREAVAAISDGREAVVTGDEQVAAAGTTFTEIKSLVANVVERAGQAAEAAASLESAGAQVNEAVDTVARVSEQNAAVSQEASAAAQEGSANAEVVTQSSIAVAGAADELGQLVSSFRY
jgi:methyl-accepting chemotaxis protein